MRVCFVGLENFPVLVPDYNHHGIGGEQVQHTLLAKALLNNGFEVSMVTLDYGQQDAAVWSGVRVFKAFRPSDGIPVLRFLFPRWIRTWAALKRANADVYYTSSAGMLVGLVSLFCRLHRRGLVFRLAHDSDTDPSQLLIRYYRDKVLYRFGLKRANQVLAQHGAQQLALYKNFKVESKLADMLVDPPGKNLELQQRDVPILWVNNLRQFKRPDLAIVLAAKLPAHELHMIGGVQQGFEGLYEKIQDQAKRMSNVVFHGRVPYHDVGDFYDRARVFINTSDSEGFPNSYLQSWRRGVPVVAFFDPNGLIRREGLGCVVQSVDEMRDVVLRLLESEDEWQKLSRRCKAYMDKHHGDELVLDPYLKAIKASASANLK